MVSMKRLPLALCVPNDSFLQMTAWRRARSLALLVISTFSWSKKFHSHCRWSYNSSHMPTKRSLPLKRRAQQQGFDLRADRCHQAFHSRTGERPVAVARPCREEFSRGPHQIVSQPLHLRVVAVDQGLKVAFQMRPAPLQMSQIPVHLCSIAVDDAVELLAREDAQCRGLARSTHREHRKHLGHERPQPRLAVFFLGRCFVDAQLLLHRQFGRQCLIRRAQRCRHLVLYFYRQRRATRLPQQRAEELGCPPLALTIEGHQQCRKGHQPWSRLALRHTDGQFRTRRCAAVGTLQPMQLVLRHVRLDLGQLPHLMPQRLRVAARKVVAATPTFGGLARLNVVALLGGNQGPLVFLVTGLPATFLLRLAFPRLRACVRMLGAGGQRGILRRLSSAFQLLGPRLQPGNFRQQQANDGLGFRRLACDNLFRDFQRHAHCCATQPAVESRSIPQKTPTGRERLPLGCYTAGRLTPLAADAYRSAPVVSQRTFAANGD